MKAALLTTLLLLLLTLAGCADVCSDTVVQRMIAPDRRHTAVMFQRDCGATTGFSTQISILSAGERLAGSGNAYRADDHGKAADGKWGGPWAEMHWLTPDRLVVRYAAKSRVFQSDASVSGVVVSYEAVSH
jgi:hypothetical protein